MPLPRSLARFNIVVTNRVLGPPAGHLPGFAVVRHVGRRSGRPYRTPVNLFKAGEGRRAIALTYGPGSQWVKNVLAAGEVELLVRGRVVRLVNPRVVHDRTLIPPPASWALAMIAADDVLLLDVPPAPDPG